MAGDPHTGAPDRVQRRRMLGGVAAVGVLVGLSIVTSWLSLSARAGTEAIRRSSEVSDAYQQVRTALLEQALVERDVRLAPVAEVWDRLPGAEDDVRRALDHVASAGTASDQVTVRRLRALLERKAAATAALLDALRGWDSDAQTEIHTTRVAPLSAQMRRQVDRAAATHRREARAALLASERIETATAIAQGVALMLTLLLGLVGWALLRARRRLDAARREELARFTQAALTDNLTGLGNHRAFQEHLHRDAPAATLVLFDLDGLKEVNDNAGHQAGDALICALTHALRRCHGTAFRIGGDEFALVMDDRSALAALGLVHALQEGLGTLADGTRVSATAGIAEASGAAPEELFRRADLALKAAKRARRGALVFSPDLDARDGVDSLAARRYTHTLATALARAVDAKDAGTRNHCETVAELCALMAADLGLPAARVARVRLAGLLHDVGKIGVPDSILQKPGSLTEEEYATMKTHCDLGYHIVSAADLAEEARWILHHHERPDGHGYPLGLAGDDIPLESRIVMVADSYEAITADRPYRRGRPPREALAELERHVGTQFDPTCVAALRRVLGAGETDAVAAA